MTLEEKVKVVGEKIRLLRLNQDMHQKDVANQIGISQACLSNIEAGRCAITLKNLFALQDVLKCQMADFFTDTEFGDSAAASVKGGNIKRDDLYNLLALLRKRK